MVYEHDKHSNRIHGYMENMYDAVVKGAEFRVRFPALDIVTRLRKVRIYYGLVCGQIIFQMKKNGYDRFQVSIHLVWVPTLDLPIHQFDMGRDMKFPTMWYVRPTKAQTSPHICSV